MGEYLERNGEALTYIFQRGYLIQTFNRICNGLISQENAFNDFKNYINTVNYAFNKDPVGFLISRGPDYLNAFYNKNGIESQLSEFDSKINDFLKIGMKEEEIINFRNSYIDLNKYILNTTLKTIENSEENKKIAEPFKLKFNNFRNKLEQLEKPPVIKQKKPDFFTRFLNSVKHFVKIIFPKNKLEQKTNNVETNRKNSFKQATNNVRIHKNKRMNLKVDFTDNKLQNDKITKENEDGRKQLRDQLSIPKDNNPFGKVPYLDAASELEQWLNRGKEEKKQIQ